MWAYLSATACLLEVRTWERGLPCPLGAVYEWDGDKNVGQGRMEIMESTPPSRVGIKLDFFKPFEAHNTAEFTMEPQGDATNVTWTIFGPMPYVSKLMTLFFDMNRMIGADFEVGLAKLKTVAEQ